MAKPVKGYTRRPPPMTDNRPAAGPEPQKIVIPDAVKSRPGDDQSGTSLKIVGGRPKPTTRPKPGTPAVGGSQHGPGFWGG